jgi:hypothetical protein
MRIFIGWDSRFPEPGLVLAHSLRSRSSRPLDVRFLDYRHLHDCYGFDRTHDPLASTEFTYSRFLVPYLCGYDGFALFMDNDMLCLGDVLDLPRSLFLKDAHTPGVHDKTLWVVKHDHQAADGSVKMYGAVQTAYPRKNWSSLMLMDCSKLKCWTKRVVETASGARLHRFHDVPDDQIEALPPEWNSLDAMDDKTKLIHWTSGGPWFEQYRDCPHADVWYKARAEAVAAGVLKV